MRDTLLMFVGLHVDARQGWVQRQETGREEETEEMG